MIALGFAELSSHYPVAGSVFQWTKYLAGKTYSWFAGWIYLFAGILTVTAVVRDAAAGADPRVQQHGLGHREQPPQPADLRDRHARRDHGLNIFGVRLVAIVNNTGVLFEILGMVVFAFILALFHHHQSGAVIFHTGGTT